MRLLPRDWVCLRPLCLCTLRSVAPKAAFNTHYVLHNILCIYIGGKVSSRWKWLVLHLTSRILVYSLAACKSSSSERGAIWNLILYTWQHLVIYVSARQDQILNILDPGRGSPPPDPFRFPVSWKATSKSWRQPETTKVKRQGGQFNNLLCGSSNRAVSCCGRLGRIPWSSLGSTSYRRPRTSSRSTHLPDERLHRLRRSAASFFPSRPLYLLPPHALRNLNSYNF